MGTVENQCRFTTAPTGLGNPFGIAILARRGSCFNKLRRKHADVSPVNGPQPCLSLGVQSNLSPQDLAPKLPTVTKVFVSSRFYLVYEIHTQLTWTSNLKQFHRRPFASSLTLLTGSCCSAITFLLLDHPTTRPWCPQKADWHRGTCCLRARLSSPRAEPSATTKSGSVYGRIKSHQAPTSSEIV
jgi:hypothetical protein